MIEDGKVRTEGCIYKPSSDILRYMKSPRRRSLDTKMIMKY
jgi:hypothetical protein